MLAPFAAKHMTSSVLEGVQARPRCFDDDTSCFFGDRCSARVLPTFPAPTMIIFKKSSALLPAVPAGCFDLNYIFFS